jgi:carbamoylphosphate synthase large subunit
MRNPELEDAVKAIPSPPDVSKLTTSEELIEVVMPNLIGTLELEAKFKQWSTFMREQVQMVERLKKIEESTEERIKQAVELERTFNTPPNA